jgi:hypothetical protein
MPEAPGIGYPMASTERIDSIKPQSAYSAAVSCVTRFQLSMTSSVVLN